MDKQTLACTKIKGHVVFKSTEQGGKTDKEKQNHSGTHMV